MPALLWSIAVMWLSTTRPETLPDLRLLQQDKLYHLGAYGLLTGLWLVGLHKVYGSLGFTKLALAILICAIYGLSIEVIQYSFFPRRSFDWADGLANVMGSLLALAVYLRLCRVPLFQRLMA